MVYYHDINKKEDYEIDIISVNEDKSCVTAYIHFPNQREYSFYISTLPHTLCYTGDLGNFIFRGSIEAIQPLNFFNRYGPNYGYWCEKLETKNGKEFDGEYFQKSILEHVVDYFYISEEEYSDEDLEEDLGINSFQKLHDVLESKEGSEVAQKFDDLMDFDFEEYNLAYIGERYMDLMEDFPEETEYMRVTSEFKICCDNLAYFSEKILEKIDYSNKDN